MKDWYEDTAEGIIIRLKIQPRASHTKIVGLHGEPPRLKIRLAAPPVDGQANEELLAFLKKALRVTFAQLQLLRGHSSSQKDILCTGVSVEQIRSLVPS